MRATPDGSHSLQHFWALSIPTTNLLTSSPPTSQMRKQAGAGGGRLKAVLLTCPALPCPAQEASFCPSLPAPGLWSLWVAPSLDLLPKVVGGQCCAHGRPAWPTISCLPVETPQPAWAAKGTGVFSWVSSLQGRGCRAGLSSGPRQVDQWQVGPSAVWGGGPGSGQEAETWFPVGVCAPVLCLLGGTGGSKTARSGAGRAGASLIYECTACPHQLALPSLVPISATQICKDWRRDP